MHKIFTLKLQGKLKKWGQVIIFFILLQVHKNNCTVIFSCNPLVPHIFVSLVHKLPDAICKECFQLCTKLKFQFPNCFNGWCCHMKLSIVTLQNNSICLHLLWTVGFNFPSSTAQYHALLTVCPWSWKYLRSIKITFPAEGTLLISWSWVMCVSTQFFDVCSVRANGLIANFSIRRIICYSVCVEPTINSMEVIITS